MSPACERLIALLRKKNVSAKTAADAVFTGRDNAKTLLARLHANRVVHIVSWECSGRGRKCPVYALGRGDDVPCPVRKTAAEKCRDYRERLKTK